MRTRRTMARDRSRARTPSWETKSRRCAGWSMPGNLAIRYFTIPRVASRRTHTFVDHAMSLFRSFVIAGALGALSTAPLSAQADPTVQRIWRLGMDSSHVQQLAQTLFDS